ncbi:MAG: D-alanine--D-alanine ligase [Candidatus Omnitrophica bacterium]|nr:D-alanine--D-alanine ligase [Candidatus Omnitrophota bacterium]
MENEKINKLKKYKIGVLAGGSSSEREISLKSGRAVKTALSGMGLNVIFINVGEKKSFKKTIDLADINIAFIALHGKFGEDGTVQKLLAAQNIIYTGSGPEASCLALDKKAAKEKFEANGIKVAKHWNVSGGDNVVDRDITFPCVVKPRFEGSSIGLSLVFRPEDLEDALSSAFEFGEEVIVEEFIDGRELTVGILGKEMLPVVEIIAESGTYDFNAKYTAGSTEYIVPAKLKTSEYRKVQLEGLKAHRALGCGGFSRVDMMLSGSGELFILEVNTIPGMTERSLLPMAAKQAGLDFNQLCVKMLLEAISADNRK